METSEALYRGLLEAAPDAIVAVSHDGRIELVNAQTEALFGYDRAELIGQPIEVLVPLADRSTHARLRQGYFRAPSTRPMGAGVELAGRRKDGSEFPAEISLSAIETPTGLLVSAAIRDGTERKQAAIINSSTDAIVSTDRHGLITSWNVGAELLHGRSSSEVLGQHLRDLSPPEDRAELDRVLGDVADRGRTVEREAVRVGVDGSPIHVSESISPLYDASGATIGITSIARDITERRRIAAEREALEQRLHQSERLESLGQLAGGGAPAFNNPLAVILNYASFVAEELDDDAPARADVEEIRQAAERAARLTKQLLIFARRETTQPEVLDLDEVVDDVQSLLGRTLGEHLELVVVHRDGPLLIRADRGQIEQVLLNLAVNARDAMGDGGTLTIETGVAVLDDAAAGQHPDLVAGRYVTLTVSDTGAGMDAATIDHAFEPFFTTKPKGAGTGLGLATVYGVVTRTGGTVTIYSELGLGTTIRAYLPPASVASDDRPRPRGTRGLRGNGETVLVVEDEDAMRKVTTRILERNGYHVISASTGAEAIQRVADAPFDLLLTDVVMPGMSGRELAAQLTERLGPIRTVFMSGYSEGVLGPRRHLDEDVSLVQKPFTEPQLIEQVHRALDADRS